MRKIPGKYVKAIIVGILGFLVIAALVVVNVSEGRKLYGETNASSLPTPTNEGAQFFQFGLLILGTIFIIGMTGFFAVFVQRADECNLKDAMLLSGLAGSIPCLIITLPMIAIRIYYLFFSSPGANATSVIFTVIAIFQMLGTLLLLDLISILFGVFAWAVRKMAKKVIYLRVS